VHDHFEQDRAAQTKRVVTAMRDPSVRMIGHLSARMIGGRPPIELDLDAVFAAAEETGTALEVNGSLPRLDLSVDALRLAQTRDVTFVLTSDAHLARELDRVSYARRNAERALDAARARREHLAGRPPRGLGRWRKIGMNVEITYCVR
jgi:DNA polymerase (family 10)